MTASEFTHQLTQLTSLQTARLGDPDALSGAVVAAAGAVGMSAYGPPVVRSGPHGTAVCLLAHGGHIVIHAQPEHGRCLVDIVATAPASAARGFEVIARRLGTP